MDSHLDSSKTFNITKPIIGYARFGRVLKFNKLLFVFQFLLLVGLFEFLVIFFMEDYFKFSAHISREVLHDGYIVTYRFFNIPINYFVVQGRLPTILESLIYLFISVIILFFLLSRFNRIPKNFSSWLLYIVFIYLISSLYFIFFPQMFPYSGEDFGKLYTLQQIGIFIFIPVIMGASLSLFTFSFLNIFLNVFTLTLTLAYSSVFGCVRYITFTIILKKFSHIHMAAMFFALGPLLDIVYVVSFYSLCLYLIRKIITKREDISYQWGL